MIDPDISVVTSFKDYSQGKDPVLEAIMKYKTEHTPKVTVASEKFTGRYSFGIDKTLEITNINGVLKADIKGRLHTVLTPVSANKVKTGMRNLFLEFKNGELIFQYPNGKKITLRKLKAEELTAFDFVATKQFDKAMKAYEDLKQKFPNDININGTNLAGLAFYLLVETRDFDIAKALLEIAIKLDPHSEVAKNLANGVKNFGK